MKTITIIFACILCFSIHTSYAGTGDAFMDVEEPQKEVVKIGSLEDYGSYRLYDMFTTSAHKYWSAFYDELDKTNALGIMASSLLVFSFCLMAGKLAIGKGLNSFIEFMGILLLTAVVLGFVQDKDSMQSFVFGFCLELPLRISSFFMDVAGAGNAHIISQLSGWEQDAAKQLDLSSVRGLFDALDANFSVIWNMFEQFSPSSPIIFVSPLVNFLMVVSLIVVYAFIYVQFLMTYIRSTALIIICSLLAPFFAAIIAWNPAKKMIVSLVKTVFYNWLVMIISTIVLGLFMATAAGMVYDLSKIDSPTLLLGSVVFTLIWFVIAYSMLSSVPSFVSQLTEMRGASPGIGAVGLTAGTVYIASKLAGLKGGNKPGGGEGSGGGNNSGNSFKQKQNAKRNP